MSVSDVRAAHLTGGENLALVDDLVGGVSSTSEAGVSEVLPGEDGTVTVVNDIVSDGLTNILNLPLSISPL